MADASVSIGMGGALAGSDLIQQWLADGVRMKVKPCGTQGDLFSGEKKMVDVCVGNKAVRISEDELQHITEKQNLRNPGAKLFGMQSPFRFEDGGEPEWVHGAYGEE